MNNTIPLVTGEIYHIYTKSIHHFKIFKRREDFKRILAILQYYQCSKASTSFCHFVRSPKTRQVGLNSQLAQLRSQSTATVDIIAYCIMTTHFHLILKQNQDNGISRLMQKSLSGYSLYYNLLHNRHGPLWQSRFGRRHIGDLGDLISTSHYVHANPVRDMGKQTPAEWKYTSYHEYLEKIPASEQICRWKENIPIASDDYQKSMTQYLIKNGLSHPPS